MTTKIITVTPTPRTIQRKLEQLELDHLREFIKQQAAVIENLSNQLELANDHAEYWRDSWFDLSNSIAEETGTAIGLTKTGELGLIAASQTQAACAIGEKWPGTDALYAGLSLSSDNTRPVHLIVWPEADTTARDHAAATAAAKAVNPEHNSHLPTRTQAIALYENLKAHFDETWYWTATKTASGKAAFVQLFDDGHQDYYDLSAECRVRAVSEIPL
ncbi:hypothetical protein [Pseudomonas sp.]|uniref:hypothetical protein n=1 Tax=Pseudomonas sp. TaxID=306 RepID=UPI003F2AA055